MSYPQQPMYPQQQQFAPPVYRQQPPPMAMPITPQQNMWTDSIFSWSSLTLPVKGAIAILIVNALIVIYKWSKSDAKIKDIGGAVVKFFAGVILTFLFANYISNVMAMGFLVVILFSVLFSHTGTINDMLF